MSDVSHEISVEHGLEHDLDAVSPEHDVSPVNSLTIAAFAAAFGGFGLLLTRVGGVAAGLAMLIAALGALLLAALFFFAVLRPLYRSQSSSSPTATDLLSAVGRVTVALPDQGVGEISLNQGGTRFSLPARSQDGSAIALGRQVAILRLKKGVAYVVDLQSGSVELTSGESG